jgi:Skp family chaperone for outer membrane proteins
MRPTPLLALVLLVVTTLLSSCQTVEYAVKERFGIHKRDILVARVHDARQAQDEARQQFASALEEFVAVTGNDGGPLAEKYVRLQREFTRSESRAATVRERIAEIDRVARALFKEWNKELGDYREASLRDASRRQLAATQERYAALATALQRAAATMDPVLDRFRDQVLFLKHNLNASAIAQLDTNHRQLESEIAHLIAAMEISIREADAFLAALPPAGD